MIEKNPDIVFIGAGNLATNLAVSLFKKQVNISQIYSRTEASAQLLAEKVNTNFTSSFSSINKNADIYICAVKDDALPAVINALEEQNIKGLVVHTAGSVDINVFKGKLSNYGVFYPLQTFSKNRELNFSEIPIFIEANNVDNLVVLKTMAISLSNTVREANSNQRKMLHLSAIFSCNFVNQMYVLGNELVHKAGFDFELLQPLINETATKIHYLSPLEAQTGPAVRFDKTVIDKHLSILSETKELQHIYKIMSESIYETQNKNK